MTTPPPPPPHPAARAQANGKREQERDDMDANERQWNKGYNATRRQLKTALATLFQMYEDCASHENMCAFAWQMYLKTEALPANDGGRVYVERAYELCHEKYWDDEYQAAKWIGV